MASADSDKVLDAVNIGDLICLNSAEGPHIGAYVRGDGAEFQIGLRLTSSNYRQSFDFEDNVFRVCPALSYRQRNELAGILQVSSSQKSKKNKSSTKKNGMFCLCV